MSPFNDVIPAPSGNPGAVTLFALRRYDAYEETALRVHASRGNDVKKSRSAAMLNRELSRRHSRANRIQAP
jgi:hypothetical protein